MPSERTRVAVNVHDGSIRVFAPKHTGAFVLYIGDLVLSTDIVGDSPEMVLDLSVASLGALLSENHGSVTDDVKATVHDSSSLRGLAYWKVCAMITRALIPNRS